MEWHIPLRCHMAGLHRMSRSSRKKLKSRLNLYSLTTVHIGVKRKIKRRRSPKGLQPQRLIMVVASTRFLVGAKERFRAHGRGAISLNHHCTSKPCERPSDERSPCSPLNTPPTVDTDCKRMVPRCQDERNNPSLQGSKGTREACPHFGIV